MGRPSKDKELDELYPDAWERFGHAVKTMMKAPPKHRTKAADKSRGAVRKGRTKPKTKAADATGAE